uniref:Uncharacterized protein n=1 Tax=Ditylenchus dipsaci TaxID=166011 RepID=A0A915DB44_9BILA
MDNGACETVCFEHWIEEDCKLEKSPNLKRVVYLAMNCLSNTTHTISVIFEKENQLNEYFDWIQEGFIGPKRGIVSE